MMLGSFYKSLSYIALFVTLFSVTQSKAQFWIEAEGGGIWQSRNDVQIPADTGTEFSLTDFETGPFAAGRIYLGYQFLENHELRALYAPLTIKLEGEFDEAVDYRGESFAPSTSTDASYQFNSYRLTYRYRFHESDQWTMKAGFTAKVRDADIELTQGNTSASRSNVGFVPLLHFAADYRFSGSPWALHLDLDALIAPQGRAEDLSLLAGYSIEDNLELRAGYRTLEGGSDGGGDVYNFSWFHYAVVNILWAPQF